MAQPQLIDTLRHTLHNVEEGLRVHSFMTLHGQTTGDAEVVGESKTGRAHLMAARDQLKDVIAYMETMRARPHNETFSPEPC